MSPGDFRSAQKRGRRFSRGGVTLIVAASRVSPRAPARLGMIIGRKVGNAVTRNKMKRWVREWFRKQTAVPRGLTLVVQPKRVAFERGAPALADDLEALLAVALKGRG